MRLQWPYIDRARKTVQTVAGYSLRIGHVISVKDFACEKKRLKKEQNIKTLYKM